MLKTHSFNGERVVAVAAITILKKKTTYSSGLFLFSTEGQLSSIIEKAFTWDARFALTTGRIQILVLTNCQAISTEIGTDSLKI